jgi:predicted P-loop ATPase
VRLTEDDYHALEKCYITRDIAIAADLYRVVSLEGRDLVARKGGGDYAGLAFPCRWPGTSGVVLTRLRLDHPPKDLTTGKDDYKYLVAAGTRNRFYWPLENPDLITNPSIPIIITEGEKKYLALHRVAAEANGSGQPAFVALGLFGAYGWKGTVGITTTAKGERVPERGVIPDFERVTWGVKDEAGQWILRRPVYILFDADVVTNPMVAAGRRELARELERRGAEVFYLNVPAAKDANGKDLKGIDDYLGRTGGPGWGEIFRLALKYDWREQLDRNEKGKILGGIANAITALRHAPAWQGVLVWNEFSLRVEMAHPPPWTGGPEGWSDFHLICTEEWLEKQGIRVNKSVAGDAAYRVALLSPYHPVREYLESLKWRGTKRLDDWLNLYLGAEANDYTRAVGARWLISAVARIFEPGCQADHMLILEGLQGIGKSTAFRILGGPFYTDNLPDITTKDAKLAIAGKWIVEVSELAAMSRAEVEHVKNFFSTPTDRLRMPYDKLPEDIPRQSVFGGSCNANQYLQDATGGRRFWPVACTTLRKADLERDRDQLWAEAVTRYKQGASWWLDSPQLSRKAAVEQDDRYTGDPWETPIAWYLETQNKILPNLEISIEEILQKVLEKPKSQQVPSDSSRVGRILARLAWVYSARRGPANDRRRVYRKKKTDQPDQPDQPDKTEEDD